MARLSCPPWLVTQAIIIIIRLHSPGSTYVEQPLDHIVQQQENFDFFEILHASSISYTVMGNVNEIYWAALLDQIL